MEAEIESLKKENEILKQRLSKYTNSPAYRKYYEALGGPSPHLETRSQLFFIIFKPKISNFFNWLHKVELIVGFFIPKIYHKLLYISFDLFIFIK